MNRLCSVPTVLINNAQNRNNDSNSIIVQSSNVKKPPRYEGGWIALLVRLLVHGSISNATCVRKKGIAVYEHILAHCTRDRSIVPFRFS